MYGVTGKEEHKKPDPEGIGKHSDWLSKRDADGRERGIRKLS